MNLKLTRKSFELAGIFGALISEETGEQIACTLEHSYPCNSQTAGYFPKVPAGSYQCVRGQHQLAHMTEPFETFEITGVPEHTNILFHVGNFNEDSEGCILLGTSRLSEMVTQSRVAFAKFMDLQSGVDQFTLVVE